MSGLRVLVFEADRGFAASLTRAFQRRGCTVTVVDDGQAGLDIAQTTHPELIILSIELPRMNGFAVCNRLKKHADLKDVPLIIVSAESPQETFEQHSKLRTRAEDYAHKPISPEELIRRASVFVAIPPVLADAQGMSIDDLEMEEPMQLSDVRDLHLHAPVQVLRPVDAELDGLTDAAFNHIMLDAPAEPEPLSFDVSLEPLPFPSTLAPAHLSSEPEVVLQPADDFEDFTVVSSSVAGQLKSALASLVPGAPTDPSPPVPSIAPTITRGSVMPPSMPSQATTAALEEAGRLRLRVEDLERELTAARVGAQRVGELTAENTRLSAQADEDRARLARELEEARVQKTKADEDRARLARELEEARARTTVVPAQTVTATGSIPPKPLAPGVSTREFLELREGLHRKDKEILALREQVNGRDKEILELRDRALQGERDKNDLEERSFARDLEVVTLQEQVATFSADRLAVDDATASLRADLSAAHEALQAQRAEHEGVLASASSDLATARAELGAVREAHTRELTAVREAHARELTTARDAHTRELTTVQTELVSTRQTHGTALAAHEARVQEITTAHSAELAAWDTRAQDLRTQSEAELARVNTAHEAQLAELRTESSQALAEAEARRSNDLATAQTAAAAAAATAAAAVAALAEAQTVHASELNERDIKAKILEAERDAHLQAHTEERDAHQATRDLQATAHEDLAARVTAAEARAEALTRDIADAQSRLTAAERVAARQLAMADRTRRALRVALAFVDEGSRTEDPPSGTASAE